MSKLEDSIKKYIEAKADPSWVCLLFSIFKKKEGIDLFRKLVSTKSWEPGLDNMLKAFSLTSYEDTNVIILGQDPYFQKDVATGLAFANKKEQERMSLPLGIIVEELVEDIGINEFIFFNNMDLEHWAEQGVLLLNSSLSVKTNQSGSHTELWKPIISEFIQKLSEIKPNIIWVLVGKQAHGFEEDIVEGEVIKTHHPAADTYNNQRFFRGSRIFSKINCLLENYGKTNISWN